MECWIQVGGASSQGVTQESTKSGAGNQAVSAQVHDFHPVPTIAQILSYQASVAFAGTALAAQQATVLDEIWRDGILDGSAAQQFKKRIFVREPILALLFQSALDNGRNQLVAAAIGVRFTYADRQIRVLYEILSIGFGEVGLLIDRIGHPQLISGRRG